MSITRESLVSLPPPPPAPQASPGPPDRRRWALFACIVAVVMIAGVLLVLRDDDTSGSRTPRQTDHMADLAERENAALAAELVPVEGYSYTDVDEAELQQSLAATPRDLVSAISMHGVRNDATGEEIAYLNLSTTDPVDAMHSLAYEDEVAAWMLEGDGGTRILLAGQTVFMVERPETPMSRFVYVWSRHGTLGWADGPDRHALETWLTKYLATPVVLPGENLELVRRLIELEDYTYTNATEDSSTAEYRDALRGVDASFHHVFDREHMFASILLAGPDIPRHTFIEAIAAVRGATRTSSVPWLTINGVDVDRFVTQSVTAFVWWWPDTGTGGALLTTRSDLGEPFVSSLLELQKP